MTTHHGLRRLARTLLLLLCVSLLGACGGEQPTDTDDAQLDPRAFRIAWSIYVGWMPWGYAAEAGIVDRWAERYGIEIDVVQVNDYIESINQYTAGAFDGCVMTNMDALTIPAAGGVDSTALIVGDFSNGNDGLVMRGQKALSDIAGMDVNLVALSVSHYLLARALDTVGLTEREVNVVNTADADIVGAFAAGGVEAAVAWNPQLSAILEQPQATLAFDSSRIPGEIIDLLVVNTDVLAANPALGKALVGAWYETMALMAQDSEAGAEARAAMAQAAGTTLASYERQLEATRMFHEPAEAAAFARSAALPETMDRVRRFSFEHGLLGPGADSPDAIGIAFPNGQVLGNEANIKLRFDSDYMAAAAASEAP